MITFSKLGQWGRLGNQLFQIAQTTGIQKSSGCEQKFPDWLYKGYFENSLDFNLIGRFPVVEERIQHIGYEHDCPKFTTDVDLHGYFQSLVYFSHCRDEIRNIFRFKEGVLNCVRNEFNYEDYTSIHIRRGDYLKPHCTPIFTTLGNAYYNKQIETIIKTTGNRKFLIFSDDIDWCVQNFQDNGMFKFCNKNDSDINDLIRMSLCQNNIIQNSSFSWWGQWLNNNADKKVVQPYEWYVPTHKKHYEYYQLYEYDWMIV